MSPGPVLVVARHGGYALELRRAGLLVVEPEDLDDSGRQLAACVIDAVGACTPEPPSWVRVEPMLRAEGAPPVVAVVSYRAPAWLASLTSSAVLVSAPISGRVLVQHVTSAVARASGAVPPAQGSVHHIIDLTTEPEQVGEATPGGDREPVGAHRSATALLPGRSRPGGAGAHGPSVPLRMARLGEVVDRLAECLVTTRSIRAVAEALAAAVSEQLSADVAVLVRRRADAPWAVLAGSGLRPLEWRPVSGDLPVLALLDARRPILRVESSDDVRQLAADLPCASRQHLVVARYPTTDVVVTAGRDAPTFDADDVRKIGALLQREAGWDDALMMCDLAEALLPYTDG